jgi:putative membrane protein
MKPTLALALAALAVASLAQVRGRGQDLSRQDRRFLQKAIQGGRAEVEMGRVAVQRGRSAQVRSLGARIVADHAQVNRELAEVVSRLRVMLPNHIGGEAAAGIRSLRSLNARRFDSTYIQMMVEDHRVDIAEFEAEVNQGSNGALREFARRTLPTLREHLRVARKLART